MRILPLALLIVAAVEAEAQIDCTFQVSPATCSAADGTVQAMVTGGTPPYTYLWAPTPPTGQGAPSIGGLLAGSYGLTVMDSEGLEASFNVVVPSNLVMPPVGDGTYAGAHAATGYGVPCAGQCNGAMLMPANMFPGTPPYSFSWNGPGIAFLTTGPMG
ncbi:MAG TPA: SprB repeat-containing protein, partial [Flavobacteriales bacterium]|nr:SprB repeat-containing protein [Flavobacteriales bacterium]